MQKAVTVVSSIVAVGTGANFVGFNMIVHYGAPASIEDYFKESGWAGRGGDHAMSTVYWIPSDAPLC